MLQLRVLKGVSFWPFFYWDLEMSWRFDIFFVFHVIIWYQSNLEMPIYCKGWRRIHNTVTKCDTHETYIPPQWPHCILNFSYLKWKLNISMRLKI